MTEIVWASMMEFLLPVWAVSDPPPNPILSSPLSDDSWYSPGSPEADAETEFGLQGIGWGLQDVFVRKGKQRKKCDAGMTKFPATWLAALQ